MSRPFLDLYASLDRQGPGEAADVAWAADVAGLARDARICDAGCGTGGDIPALLNAAPEGRITAIDREKAFVNVVLARFGEDRRITAFKGDIVKLKGPFDFIWCAGAMYFLGTVKALRAWRPALAKGGAVAFSAPAWLDDAPSPEAQAFWRGEKVQTPAQIGADVEDAGYRLLDSRVLSDTAWEGYYGPMERRMDLVRDGAGADMAGLLTACAAEAATWRQIRHETGYLLSVVRPA